MRAKLAALASLLIYLGLMSGATGAELFIYLSPTGNRVVTDRPIDLAGFVLEQTNIDARAAGRSLRYQDTEKNRDLIDRYIRNAAYLYDMDAALIRAVIAQESAFKIDARSPKGALGLMQLMPPTARQYQVQNMLDPRENINAGTKHLKYLLQRFSSLSLALAAYNAGEGAVAKYQGIPPYPETENYVTQVLGRYQDYQSN
ncbi:MULTISPECIES: lytic transglycosylase domain-containing protein [Reinekea]|nr:MULTISPECIES: lytic transglycosylase domain-containing protein [Reinekea]